jgi:hypothetical protein
MSAMRVSIHSQSNVSITVEKSYDAGIELTPIENATIIAQETGLCPEGSGEVEENEGAGARTQDLRIKSPLLYQLSYTLKTGASEVI